MTCAHIIGGRSHPGGECNATVIVKQSADIIWYGHNAVSLYIVELQRTALYWHCIVQGPMAWGYLKDWSIGTTNKVQLIHNEQRHVPDLLPRRLPPPPAQHVPVLRSTDDYVCLPQHGVVGQGVPSQQADVEAQARSPKLLAPVCKALLGQFLLGGNVDCP